MFMHNYTFSKYFYIVKYSVAHCNWSMPLYFFKLHSVQVLNLDIVLKSLFVNTFFILFPFLFLPFLPLFLILDFSFYMHFINYWSNSYIARHSAAVAAEYSLAKKRLFYSVLCGHRTELLLPPYLNSRQNSGHNFYVEMGRMGTR